MITAIDKLALLASLELEYCELSHGPKENPEDYKAVDYLTQPVGKTDGDNTAEDLHHMVIPVCKDCAEGLIDNDWILMYCLDCKSSQWLCRSRAKLEYGMYDLIWLKGCPKCSKEPTAVYFN